MLILNYGAGAGVLNQDTIIKIPIQYGKYFNSDWEVFLNGVYDGGMPGTISHRGKTDDSYNYIKSQHSIHATSTMSILRVVTLVERF